MWPFAVRCSHCGTRFRLQYVWWQNLLVQLFGIATFWVGLLAAFNIGRNFWLAFFIAAFASMMVLIVAGMFVPMRAIDRNQGTRNFRFASVAMKSILRIGATLAILGGLLWFYVNLANASRDAAAIEELNTFCGKVRVGQPKAEVLDGASRGSQFRVADTGDLAFVSKHRCHCLVGFRDGRVSGVDTARCND